MVSRDLIKVPSDRYPGELAAMTYLDKIHGLSDR
jgi:hypothetical protein